MPARQCRGRRLACQFSLSLSLSLSLWERAGVRVFALAPRSSRRSRGRINLPMLPKPRDIASLGVFLDFSQQVDRLRFIAWLTRIIRRNDHFHLDGHNVLVRLDEPLPFHALSKN